MSLIGVELFFRQFVQFIFQFELYFKCSPLIDDIPSEIQSNRYHS